MKLKSKISVIVVCYNQEDTLARTLDSILAQKGCSPYEILVSDDCSKDGTAAVARRYAERYPEIVKVHVNAVNKGVQANYFDAMRRAEGDYIADCAGDDFWCDSEKLAKEERILDSRADVSIVHTGFDYCHTDGHRERFVGESDVRERATDSLAALEENLCGSDTPFMHLCTALYRKAPILADLNRYPELFLNPEYKCEDLQVMTAACAAGNVVYLPESTLCYGIGHSSISSTETFLKTFDFYFATTRLRLELLRVYKIRQEKARSAIRQYSDFLMAQAFHGGSRKRMDALADWMKSNNQLQSAKFRIFHAIGKTALRKPVSRILLSCRKHSSKR
jgi:glycosyltransferase involved in cell wall biosynthesis